MTYEIQVAGLIRHLPLCPISDTLMIGGQGYPPGSRNGSPERPQ